MIIPANEVERLAALTRYAILDTPSDTEFDEFARLAATVCNAPIALISFIDGERNWIKSQVGFDVLLGVDVFPLGRGPVGGVVCGADLSG